MKKGVSLPNNEIPRGGDDADAYRIPRSTVLPMRSRVPTRNMGLHKRLSRTRTVPHCMVRNTAGRHSTYVPESDLARRRR